MMTCVVKADEKQNRCLNMIHRNKYDEKEYLYINMIDEKL